MPSHFPRRDIYVRGQGHTKRGGGTPVGRLPTVGEVTVGWWHCDVCRRRTRWVGQSRRSDDPSPFQEIFCLDCSQRRLLEVDPSKPLPPQRTLPFSLG